jgi:hypothetical protein
MSKKPAGYRLPSKGFSGANRRASKHQRRILPLAAVNSECVKAPIRRQLNEYLAAQRFPLGWVVALRSATPTEFDDDLP